MKPSAAPFRQFVLKVASRCDLACDHCYVYEHADQSWRGRPVVMSDETIAWSARRIAEHAGRHGLPEVHVVLHGGEPLLAGRERLARVADELRGALDGVCAMDLRVHTNGVLLDEEFCALFAEHGIKVGVSLDGDRVANDRHRRYANGRSSYDKVIRAVELLRRHPELYAGLLCTVDVANDPVAVYEALAELDPPHIDFLLPHATWDRPPPGLGAYGDWLIKIFDRWMTDGRPVSVRTFDSVLRIRDNRSSLTESLGPQPSDLVVIETDGSYEQVDSLKTAYDGAPATGMGVRDHCLDEVARHPGFGDRRSGTAGLSAQCRACPVVETCGGGLYTHRYRTGSAFDNPSVYCADLLRLITHVDEAVSGLAPHAFRAADIAALAAGYGEGGAIVALEGVQRSLRRALLGRVGAVATSPEAWRLLTLVDQESPDALNAVLAHPYVRVWAVLCLTGDADDAHLSAIAVTAALRAGIETSLRVPVRDGALHLPGLGRLDVGPVDTVTVTTGDGWFAADAGGRVRRVDLGAAERVRPVPGWSPVRRLVLGDLSVALDDVDPYRDCHEWPVADRLGEAELERWSGLLRDAWTLIVRDHPAYAPALAAGLTTIIPLVPRDDGRQISSAARQAFGAVAVAAPSDAVTLALLLIHEFQHVKLGAVLDMLDLYDAADTSFYYAPWRDDPRPLEGLLQGTYAHVAVADFWRVRRVLDEGAAARKAAIQFAHWRSQTAQALKTLNDSGALTETGRKFADAMTASVGRWLDEPVSPGAEDEARRRAEAHRETWARSAPLRG
ncbi:FxsB family cyclophane-forming radical SAM/SPASM peptide maturase [Streptosporangium sp. NPDC002524]|uniref:FxsB family cyclophane-forming radical SAM/SPASM peptide maturase n=1 Tax=Streptosporangium sp. NPDC002524 TaxID=3154537 RepID=UPI0033295330